jgi:hypothetical protein
MFNHIRVRAIGYSLAVFVAGALLCSASAVAQDKEGAGVVVSGKASAKDIGLPIYPGSKPHKDKDDDSGGANLGLWGGGAGFKLAVLKMESNDSAEKVAAFYRKALSKYGDVLDCSNPPKAKETVEKGDTSKGLTCGDDKPEEGGLLYKAGTKDKQHIVGIQPNGTGTVYQLVNVGAWGNNQ